MAAYDRRRRFTGACMHFKAPSYNDHETFCRPSAEGFLYVLTEEGAQHNIVIL